MYTFYFRVCPTGLSATTRAKLIAVNGIHTPLSPALGEIYDEAMMRNLVRVGHKVVIEPAEPSSAPCPSVCHGKGDTAVPTMRYAHGYGAPKLRIPEYSDWAGIEWLRPVGIKVAPTIGPLPPQAPLAPEPISDETVRALKDQFCGSAAAPFYKVEYHVPLPKHVGETVVGVPEWSSGVTIPDYAQSAAMTALRKACFSPDPPPKSIHFTDDECRLTRWERIKGWFSRNFIPN